MKFALAYNQYILYAYSRLQRPENGMASKQYGRTQAQRKRLFKAAMVYFGYTRETWARKHGFSPGYVDRVRGGFEQNARLNDLMDVTIARLHEAVVKELAA